MIGSMGWSLLADGVAVDIELIEYYCTVGVYTAIFWIAVFGLLYLDISHSDNYLYPMKRSRIW